MTPHQNISGLIDPRRQISRPSKIRMQFFHKHAVRTNQVLTRGTLLKPQNLISFIFGHRAIARRRMPRVSFTLTCCTPSGKSAVEISFQ